MTETRTGWLAGFAAYGLWGLFPLYFLLFDHTGPFELVAHRAVWSLAVCVVLLTLGREWPRLRAVVGDRRVLGWMMLAGALITVNWTTYVVAVLSDRTLEAAMGYFINPLAVVALGMVVFRERLRPLQRVAIGLGVLAVAVMVVAYGKVPWVALTLAASFGLYSMVKKMVGGRVGPVEGLTLETATVAPLALGLLVWLGVRGTGSFGPDGYGALLATTGIVTAVPLLLFAVAARHLPMLGLGMLQYLAPIGQFLIGWLVLGEPMPAARWAGFVIVWLAVAVFVADAVRNAPRRRSGRMV